MANKTLTELLDQFGFVTVMDAHVFKLPGFKRGKNILTSDQIVYEEDNCLCLQTLQISNIKESGPNKTFNAGLFNVPVIRTGKKVTIEMKDALGNLDTLQSFFGLKASNERMYSSNFFPEPLLIEGTTKILNIKGEIEKLYVFIPFMLPNGVLTITQDSGNNLGVFDLSGTLYPCNVQLNDDEEPHVEFYSLSTRSVVSNVAFIHDGDIVTIEPAENGTGSSSNATHIKDGDTVVIEPSEDEEESSSGTTYITNFDTVTVEPDEN